MASDGPETRPGGDSRERQRHPRASHFIKTVEDLYEVMVTSVPGAAFGLRSTRRPAPAWSGWKAMTTRCAPPPSKPALALGAGHTFVLYLRNAFPSTC